MSKVLALGFILCSYNGFQVQSRKNAQGLDSLLDDVIGEIPRDEKSAFFSQMLKNEKNTFLKSTKKTHLTVSPAKDEPEVKKSSQAIPKVADNPAISLATANANVYFVHLGIKTPLVRLTTEYDAAKRFRIPKPTTTLKHDRIPEKHLKEKAKSKTAVKYNRLLYVHRGLDRKGPTSQNALERAKSSVAKRKLSIPNDSTAKEFRTKRQEEDSLTREISTSGSMQNAGIQTLPVQVVIPAQSTIGDAGFRSDLSAINSKKVVAMLPVKVEAPLASPASVATVSQTPQVVEPEILGTSRSTLPVKAFIQTSPDVLTNTPRSPGDGNLFVQLKDKLNQVGDQENRFADQENRFAARDNTQIKVTPESSNEVIKLAQVPLSLLDQKTKHLKDVKTSSEESSDQLAVKPLNLGEDGGIVKESTKDVNKETLMTLHSRLTNIISKLEARVENRKGSAKLKQLRKEEALNSLTKNKPSKKSLRVLRKRLSYVLKKFNSRYGSGQQPFTIGNEWHNVLKESEHSHHPKKDWKMKSATETDGNWPSIASQLLRKLNRALIQIQEKQVARLLGKKAVMYFSFDKVATSIHSDNSIEDKSGHFNDASASMRAHVSSRSYGSCGKAMILDSGNIYFTSKDFKEKPTKAITLAMWVRTNVTGYVKWFARDSESSREFNTHTQYPLVSKNVWTHLCGTYNISTGITRIYVDGELKTERVNQQEDTIPADFTPAGIGPAFGDDSLIAVDEVYMFATALDPSEVRTLYDNCEFNRMVVHYGFQKINRSSGVVFDQSGLHNNADVYGGARVLDSGCDKCGSCLDLNAKGNPRLSIEAAHFKHKPTKAISVGAWFNLNSTSGTHPLFRVTETISRSPILGLLVKDGKLEWKGYNRNHYPIFNMASKQAVVPEGIWIHIIATYDSVRGQAKIFINGHQKELSKTKKAQLINEWGEILIGGRESGVQATIGGYVDEIVLYNWELEPSEISYIMKYCPEHPKLVSFTVHVPLD